VRTQILISVLAISTVSGCALIDGLNGVDDVNADEFCEAVDRKVDACNTPPLTQPTCPALHGCFDSLPESCSEPWSGLKRCIFGVEDSCGVDDLGDPMFCVEETQSLIDCMTALGADLPMGCNLADISPPPDCGGAEGCAGAGEQCTDRPCDQGLVCTPPNMNGTQLCTEDCRTNTSATCPADTACRAEDGLCVGGGCTDAVDCSPGLDCIGGSCVPVTTGRCDDGGAMCGPGSECIDGACVAVGGQVCSVSGECQSGWGCVNLRQWCEQSGRFGRPEACEALGDDNSYCRSPCSRNEDCSDGDRCWFVLGGWNDAPSGGYCAPGMCDPGDGSCQQYVPDYQCLDTRGPGSGVCGTPCQPNDCDQTGSCPQCSTAEEQNCAPLNPLRDSGGETFACARAGGTMAGGDCGGAPDIGRFECQQGTFCVVEDPATTGGAYCARYCQEGATGPCESSCEPFGAASDVGFCPGGGGGGGSVCGSDGDCGMPGSCRNTRVLCESSAGAEPFRNWCGNLPASADEQRCRQSCDPLDTAGGCPSGERCWPSDGDPNANGWCGPGQCSVDVDCGGGNTHCIDVDNGVGSGVCAEMCTPGMCDDTTQQCSDCSDASRMCAPMFTHKGGGITRWACTSTGGATGDGGQCSSHEECLWGSACVSDGADPYTCRELCALGGFQCNGGGNCGEYNFVTEHGDVGTCSTTGGTSCVDDPTSCGAQSCIDIMAPCTGLANPYSDDCGWLSPTNVCDYSCPPYSSGSACGSGQHCYDWDPANDSGVCGPGQCDDGTNCGGAGDVCVDKGGTQGGGICAQSCDPRPGVASTCGAQQTCLAARNDNNSGIEFVCAAHQGYAEGTACRPFSNDCGADLVCAEDGGVDHVCRRLCDPADAPATCGPGVACESLNVDGYGIGLGAGVCAQGGSANLPNGSDCSLDTDCASGRCEALELACADGEFNLVQQGCDSASPVASRICADACTSPGETCGTGYCLPRSDGVNWCEAENCTLGDCGVAATCFTGMCHTDCDPATCGPSDPGCACVTSGENCRAIDPTGDDQRGVCSGPAGTVPEGSVCQHPWDCDGGLLCLDVLGNDVRACTRLCEGSTDCMVDGFDYCGPAVSAPSWRVCRPAPLTAAPQTAPLPPMWSVEMHIQTTATSGILWSKGPHNHGDPWKWITLQVGASGALELSFDYGVGTSTTITAPTPVVVSDGLWHHVGLSYDAMVGFTLRVDNQVQFTGGAAGTETFDMLDAMVLGGAIATDGVALDPFVGLVDQFVFEPATRGSYDTNALLGVGDRPGAHFLLPLDGDLTNDIDVLNNPTVYAGSSGFVVGGRFSEAADFNGGWLVTFPAP
jgi:hypothetical protein